VGGGSGGVWEKVGGECLGESWERIGESVWEKVERGSGRGSASVRVREKIRERACGVDTFLLDLLLLSFVIIKISTVCVCACV